MTVSQESSENFSSEKSSFAPASHSLRLEKLVIEGFKSFASRIQIQLRSGITAIVGPNGCGKSNIVDAIRWVLGEPSAKSLRADSMQDVLFAGAHSQQAASLCQVSLELSGAHPSRPLLIDRFEIERRLFRTGESEYRLNKRACRLRDIHELFADTGIGRNAFAIFEQGRLEQMIMMSSAQRRLLIEEAAGIAGFKIQKKEALAKWQLIDIQLQQVSQVYQEIDGRLSHLKDQSQKALEWQSCQTEIERLVRLGQIYKWNLLDTQRQELTSVIKQLENQLETYRLDKEKAQKSLEDQDILFEKEQGHLVEKKNQYHEAREKSIEASQSLKYLETQSLEDGRLKTHLGDHLNRVRLKYQNLTEQLKRSAFELEGLSKQISQNESDQHGFEERLESFKEDQTRVFKRKQDLESQHLERTHQKQLLEQKKQSQKNEHDQLWRQIQSNEEALKKYQLEESSIQLEIERLGSLLDKTFNEEEAGCEIDLLKKQIFHEEGALEEFRREFNDVQAQRKQLQTNLQWLQDKVQSSNKTFSQWISSRLLPHERLLIKPLSEWLSQEISGQELAFWRHLEPVQIVSSSLLGKLENLLQDSGAPAFALWPIEVLDHENFETKARSLIKTTLESSFQKNRETNWKSWGKGLVRFDELGVIWSMDRSASQAEMLGEIPLQKTKLEERILKESQLLKGIEEKKSFLLDLKTKKERLEKQLSLEVLERQKQRSKEESLRSRLGFLKEEILVKTPVVASLKSVLEPLLKKIEECSFELESLKSQSSSQEELVQLSKQIQELSKQVQTTKFQKEQIDKTLSRTREQVARVQVQIQSAQSSYDEIEASIKADEEAFERQVMKEKETLASYEKAKEAESFFSKKSQLLLEELQKDETDSLGLKQSIKDLQKKIKTLETRIEQQQLRLIEERKKLDEIHWSKQSLESSIDVQEAQLWDGVFVDPSQIQSEIQSLKNRQQELGFVNFAAAKELKELQERHGLILVQIEDVERSKLELMRVIAHLDEKCRVQFEETFSLVRQSFTRNFIEIFEGGNADLFLSGNEESQGVEITACPPGKQIRSLSLMSGGEKCLTALSFMMALFEVRPAPFCLLDEVDAPLDDANVEKLIRLLKHYSDRTQIFVITHNKKTMAAASTLLGVSMPKRGVSQIFVLDVNARSLQQGAAHSLKETAS